MTTIIHCADLHLTSGKEKEYSLSVLDEILTIADKEWVGYLLICGDLFDSFDDAVDLRAEFRSRIAPISSKCQILYIPGNHEDLGKGNRTLSSLDLGTLTVCYTTPFEVIAYPEIEFLCIPHQTDYRDYHEWSVPPKKAPFRVASAHGLVSGIDIYAGPESEEEGAVGTIDPDLFTRFDVDYAAMGHIHTWRKEQYGRTWISYPGSSRVWRRGENGPRGVNLIKTNQSVQIEFFPLASSGRYRQYHLPLTLEGSIEDLETLTSSWKEKDWIDLNFSGIVEDENVVGELEKKLRSEQGERVRKIEIDRTDVQPLPGIMSQTIVKQFLETWKKKKPASADDRAHTVWLKARQMGLEQIKNVMEAKKC
jgi:DNA repair exonuclease SbcCD nuclease subunit